MADFKVTGLDDMQRKLQALGKKYPVKIRAALFQEAEAIMRDSKTIVPVDFGTLKSSGHVMEPRHTEGHLIVELTYGGPSAPYALEQHEELGYLHEQGQQAKYLEVPLFNAAPRLIGNLARRIRLS